MEHFESLYPANTRETEIANIISFIKEGSSCQIIGLPGGGRSNLLGLLTYNRNVRLKHLGVNQKWFHFVLCNFAEVRKRPLTDVTKFLFLSLIDSVHSRHSGKPSSAGRIQNLSGQGVAAARDAGSSTSMTEKDVNYDYVKTLNEIFSESVVGNDELVLFQGLKRAIDLLSIEKELTIVFLFDRFEDYIPSASPEFFTNLRMLRDRAKYRFSVVFSLHKPLEDLIGEDILLDFYQFVAGHTVYLSILDKIGIDFRISYIEKSSGKSLDKKLIDEILKQTAGHPNLTRLSVEAMIDSNQQLATSNQKLAKTLLEQKPIKAALLDIWKSLSPAEQNILATSNQQLATSLKNENTSYLENVGLIKDYKITIPLFAQFVKMLDKQSSNVPFDLNTLSDSLTSSEFKLLSYLLQNTNKIIEREEIINAVWTDNKSSAGVTDQALDQLIFRVRRKIEDNPISPSHLLTVKGRGFRFTP